MHFSYREIIFRGIFRLGKIRKYLVDIPAEHVLISPTSGDIAAMSNSAGQQALRARRRTFRLHFYHAIGFPSNLADDLVRGGNLVGWWVTLRPLATFGRDLLPDHPDATDMRALFAAAASVNTLGQRSLADLMDWITVRDDIWRQLRAHVRYNPGIHRDDSVRQWEARRRRALDNLCYISLRNVDPASRFANAVVSEWDLTMAQIVESGLLVGDQIIAWYGAQCEDLVGGACTDAVLPLSVRQLLEDVRAHHA